MIANLLWLTALGLFFALGALVGRLLPWPWGVVGPLLLFLAALLVRGYLTRTRNP